MSNLSKKELAAMDLLIAQMEETPHFQAMAFIGSALNAVAAVCPAVAQIAGVGAGLTGVARNAATSPQQISNQANIGNDLTLEDLKAVRKQYS
jgi:hypothetical protein